MKVFILDYVELLKKCREIIPCDVARISKPKDKLYLIIGFNMNTNRDSVSWMNDNNEKIDFEYVQESIVASGYDEYELLESAKAYNKLTRHAKEYFEEIK